MDYFSRVKDIQRYLAENRLSAFLVLTKVNRQYISGFTGSAGVVVITPSSSPPVHFVNRGRKSGGAELFVDERYLIRARRESRFVVRNMKDLGSEPIYRPINGRATGIAIEDRITLREVKWLRKAVKARLVPTRDVVENLRAVKTIGEIREIRKAQKIIDEIFKHIVKLLRKNSPYTPSLAKRGRGELFTEAAVALEIERLAKKLGADGMAFEPIVAWGLNAAAPHHLSENRKIGRNDFLLLDFGVLINGYHSDFTRTLFIGKPNRKQEKVYETVREAQIRGIGEIREGVKASQVDTVARRFIGNSGFGKYFTHNTGHGVGLEIHELPNFAPASEDVLRKNMIVTVEPGIYIEGWGGVRIEDMIVVTERGAEALSKVSKSLKDMIIK